MMRRFRFTSYVLGKQATEKLRAKKVTQTIRGSHTDIIQAYGERNFDEFGERILIVLDKDDPSSALAFIGYARLVSIEQVNWVNLLIEDALRGGFLDLNELEKALKRAGYRFKDLEDYDLYRVRFKWE